MQTIPKYLLLCFLWFCIALWARGQDHHARYLTLDVLSYRFEIDLNDSTDVIRGKADMHIAFRKNVEQFHLDLGYTPENGKGMQVSQVTEDGRDLAFHQQHDRITLDIPPAVQGSQRSYQITYSGVPADGLIITKNKFGDRTFFGDNWPNRGHHWLPLVDHPSDKAFVEFVVSAPDHYKVVAVGKMTAEIQADGRICTHWSSTVPLSTKLMVIGVSPFAVQEMQSASGIPVSTWVYPQNREDGFTDYSIAPGILDYYESYIAPFPYAKLANVQSKTVYGGMENASCIFYHERTVNGRQDNERLFAHEIAHQWFGDAVSELDWHHIWLSEGFATYLTHIYIEHNHGREAFVASMLDEREQVLRFARRRLAPIVDTTLDVSVRLLNKNTYEKAAWVLHMLRHELGDTKFQECIRAFYEQYKFSNALTEDFRKVVESVSRTSYERFFHQWFYQPGHPVISASWKQRGQKIILTIDQHQEPFLFQFPIEIELRSERGETLRETLRIQNPSQRFKLKPGFRISEIILDPEHWLLFESYEEP
jgi:aminopeptidase N